MGFLSKVFKTIISIPKKAVKGFIGSVRGTLDGDPMAMVQLAAYVYGAYQGGQFLANSAHQSTLAAQGAAGTDAFGIAQGAVGTGGYTPGHASFMGSQTSAIKASQMLSSTAPTMATNVVKPQIGSAAFWNQGRVVGGGGMNFGSLTAGLKSQVHNAPLPRIDPIDTSFMGKFKGATLKDTFRQAGSNISSNVKQYGKKFFSDPGAWIRAGAGSADRMAMSRAQAEGQQQLNYTQAYAEYYREMANRYRSSGSTAMAQRYDNAFRAVRSRPPSFGPYLSYMSGEVARPLSYHQSYLQDAINTDYTRRA